jgi:hypothetical protein
MPFDFPLRGILPLLMPSHVYAPFNSLATLHSYSALWSILLPTTVHDKISDIWRGYVAQRLLNDVKGRVVFMPPIAAHYHNIHDHLADFDAEEPLYTRSLPLIKLLHDWSSRLPTLPGRIENIWVMMFEYGFVGEADVLYVQLWLKALVAMSYVFPEVL